MDFNKLLCITFSDKGFLIGDFEIRWYAVIIVTGMIAAMILSSVLFKRRGENPDIVLDLAVVVLPLAVIGARFYFVIFDATLSYSFVSLFAFWDGVNVIGILFGILFGAVVAPLLFGVSVLRILGVLPPRKTQREETDAEGNKTTVTHTQAKPTFDDLLSLSRFKLIAIGVLIVISTLFFGRLFWLFIDDGFADLGVLFGLRNGGMAIYGGVIGGLIGVIIVMAYKKYGFRETLKICDCIAPVLLLGQAIGRWGNFVNGEAYGQIITNEAWQFFPFGVYIDGVWHQATFFYESFFNIIGAALLYLFAFRISDKKETYGLVACGYFGWYGITRKVVEGFRDDSLYVTGDATGSFRVSQILSFVLVIMALFIALLLLRKVLSRRQKVAYVSVFAIFIFGFIAWIVWAFVINKDPAFYPVLWTTGFELGLSGLVGAYALALEKKRFYLYLTAGAFVLSTVCFLCTGVYFTAAIALAVGLVATVICSLIPAKPPREGSFDFDEAEEIPRVVEKKGDASQENED